MVAECYVQLQIRFQLCMIAASHPSAELVDVTVDVAIFLQTIPDLQKLQSTIRGKKCEVHVTSVLEEQNLEDKMADLSVSTKVSKQITCLYIEIKLEWRLFI